MKAAALPGKTKTTTRVSTGEEDRTVLSTQRGEAGGGGGRTDGDGLRLMVLDCHQSQFVAVCVGGRTDLGCPYGQGAGA